MNAKFKNILVCTFILTFFACHKAAKVGLIDEIREAPKYHKTIKEWTKDTRHYYFNEVQFFMTAAYKSLPLRLAYIKEYAKKYKISEAEQRTMYEKELSDFQNYNDFFVTVFSSKDDIHDLNDEKKWRLFVSAGRIENVRLEPLSIEKVGDDSVIRYFYPQVTPWTSNFLVRFSKTMTDANGFSEGINFSTIRLLLASVVGEKTFTWKLAGADLAK